jgi:hypothetical protein
MSQPMQVTPLPLLSFDWSTLSTPSKILVVFGVSMGLACAITFLVSLNDARTIYGVGVWSKPMKFMASTALFALSTVWLAHLANPSVTFNSSYQWIAGLLIVTSLFEVVYITFQGARAQGSHYNVSNALHAAMFGLMAVAAVGLTASQAWLAWEIWKARTTTLVSPVLLSVVMGLTLTFVLATISGFMLGGNRAPAGQGLPIVGWHLVQDIRPSHFLGVHAQQFIPLWGIVAERLLGQLAVPGVVAGALAYTALWLLLTRLSFGA